jgi:hypothetical protein
MKISDHDAVLEAKSAAPARAEDEPLKDGQSIHRVAFVGHSKRGDYQRDVKCHGTDLLSISKGERYSTSVVYDLTTGTLVKFYPGGKTNHVIENPPTAANIDAMRALPVIPMIPGL